MKRIFVDISRCVGCRSCEIACALKHSKSHALFEAINEEPLPLSRIKVTPYQNAAFPLQCRQCEEPVCMDACIANAIRKEDGIVVTNEEKCVHCYSCMMVCPFGVIRIGGEGEAAVKCDLCQDEDVPPCVKACPTKALFFGELEEFQELMKEREKSRKKNALSYSG